MEHNIFDNRYSRSKGLKRSWKKDDKPAGALDNRAQKNFKTVINKGKNQALLEYDIKQEKNNAFIEVKDKETGKMTKVSVKEWKQSKEGKEKLRKPEDRHNQVS